MLSDASRTYWPTTLYELAHETVHILNPISGTGNYLEEGYAVLFSIDMSEEFTSHPQEPGDEYYQEALRLIKMLDNKPYRAARMIRNKFGSLSSAKEAEMEEMFPHVPSQIIRKLCSTFGS